MAGSDLVVNWMAKKYPTKVLWNSVAKRASMPGVPQSIGHQQIN